MSKLTFTDWLRGVREELTLKTRDPRVRAAAPSTGANEAVGGEGGFAVPVNSLLQSYPRLKSSALPGFAPLSTLAATTSRFPLMSKHRGQPATAFNGNPS